MPDKEAKGDLSSYDALRVSQMPMKEVFQRDGTVEKSEFRRRAKFEAPEFDAESSKGSMVSPEGFEPSTN